MYIWVKFSAGTIAALRASTSLAPIARHLPAAAAFAILALTWTFPLAGHLSTHVPGGGAGDNLAFLWNFWWMRHALAAGADPLHSNALFAPAGVDLTLHTHTALPAFAGATALAVWPIAAALNLTILVSLFLNGLLTYLCAWQGTRDRAAAVIAGLIFAGSPFISAHLNGHFNLTTAWTVPLFALTASRAFAGRSWTWTLAAGIVLGATVYVDYYLVVMQGTLALCLWAAHALDLRVRTGARTRALRAAGHVAAAAAALALAGAIAIGLTGGGRFEIGALRISARSAFNLMQAFWILAAIRVWTAFPVRPALPAWRGDEARRATGVLLGVVVLATIAAAPVVSKAAALAARGEYVTQQYFWRNAPKGVDVATLLLGNPFHGWWGGSVRRAYAAMDIDTIESTMWLGVVPSVLLVWCVARRWHDAAVRRWAAIGGVFLVWALGPHLMVAGMNTGLLLPQALLRYFPLLSNARIPGRAMVMVYLALAMLCAMAIAGRRPAWLRRAAAIPVLAAAIVFDYVPAPFPVFALDHPRIYDTLRDRPEPGTVCELPLGIRDGFGERGRLDHRVLFYQSIHGRPLTGGFVARLPPGVLAAYEADPLLAALLRLSGTGDSAPGTLPDRSVARQSLRGAGIRFVMLQRAGASPALTAYVEQVLPLSLIQTDGDRSLYIVDDR